MPPGKTYKQILNSSSSLRFFLSISVFSYHFIPKTQSSFFHHSAPVWIVGVSTDRLVITDSFHIFQSLQPNHHSLLKQSVAQTLWCSSHALLLWAAIVLKLKISLLESNMSLNCSVCQFSPFLLFSSSTPNVLAEFYPFWDIYLYKLLCTIFLETPKASIAVHFPSVFHLRTNKTLLNFTVNITSTGWKLKMQLCCVPGS